MKNIDKVLVTSMSNMMIGWKLILSVYRLPDYATNVKYVTMVWTDIWSKPNRTEVKRCRYTK